MNSKNIRYDGSVIDPDYDINIKKAISEQAHNESRLVRSIRAKESSDLLQELKLSRGRENQLASRLADAEEQAASLRLRLADARARLSDERDKNVRLEKSRQCVHPIVREFDEALAALLSYAEYLPPACRDAAAAIAKSKVLELKAKGAAIKDELSSVFGRARLELGGPDLDRDSRIVAEHRIRSNSSATQNYSSSHDDVASH